MNRFCKIIAVLLAMLMLATMATACKRSDDEFAELLGPNNNGGGFISEDLSENQDAANDKEPTEDNEPNNSTDNTEEGNADENADAGNNTVAGDKENNSNDHEENAGNDAAENVNSDADEDKQNQIIEDFDATKKYDFASNPLLAESKPLNDNVEPGFDIDTTGFVKNGIKVSDLKGKSLTMITALEQANWFYYGPNGETYDEWTWFESLKKTYGLNFKFIESRFDKAPQQMIAYMNAGKQLDIIPTHRSAFPQFILLSQGLDPYINTKYVDNSPGVDSRTLEQTKWDGTYRCIGPIGAVEVMWYNETMVESLGLDDPHKLWKEGKWDWEAWKSFVVAVPVNAPNGKTKLCPWAMSEGNAWDWWARTNGVAVFDAKTENNKTTIISNFEHPDALEAWTFYSDTIKSVDALNRRSENHVQDSLYKDGATIMCYTAYLMRDYYPFEYARTQRYNWVPYPKGPAEGGECVVMNYGNTMMLPKKVKNQSNIPYAVKLMEIWANRFTEALNDYFQAPFYRWTYEQRIEYFNYAAKNNQFSLGARVFGVLTGDDLKHYNNFYKSFYSPDWNTATEAAKVKNVVEKALKLCQEYGV